MNPVLAMKRAERAHKAGDLAHAMRGYAEILEQHPDFLPAYFNAGIVAYQLKEYTRARLFWERVLRDAPMNATTHYNLATCLQETGQIDAALDHYKLALAIRPEFPECLTNAGTAYLAKGDMETAIQHFTKATEYPTRTPEARFNRAFANLLLGRFREGWEDYEGRWETPLFQAEYTQRHHETQWRGEPNVRLFLWAEQGFGDVLMMWRFLRTVVNRLEGGHLIVEVQPALYRLLRDNALPQVSVRKVGDPTPDFDVQLPIMSLPHVLGVTLETIPPTPYLWSVEAPAKLPKEGGRNVGLVWAGSAKHRNDKRRSIPPRELSPLFRVPGVQWWIIQQERLEELREVEADEKVRWIELSDFAHTAALIDGLDLVVTVDTAVAHLAGAMGKPCWLLLSAWPDFRWLLNTNRSPWYKSLRLFRQDKIGDWQPVIRSVCDALAL